MVEATASCGPAHCEISCVEGKMCKDKAVQMICIPQKVLGKEDVCCKNYSCSDEEKDDKASTGTGFKFSLFSVALLCASAWIVL